MSTYFPKANDLKRQWFLVDATGIPVGRLSSAVAEVLSGKNKPTWTPFLDTGDHVIVINAAKAVLTGKKGTQKMYRRTTTQPGSMVETRAEVMQATFPERLIESAVKGMLPKGPLGRAMYRKLKVYAGSEHEHAAQQPQVLTIQK
ncbi:MAG TPA: 50S ribosomal protein L13 [Holophagaceae bacterium]